MSRLDKIREAPDLDSALEEAVAARRATMDPKDMFGGPRDWVDQALPPIAFVVGNAIGKLDAGIRAALVALALVVVVRLVRRETLRHAFSGTIGVLVAVLIAKRTGEAKNFFLPGIVINGVYALAFFLSALLRKPLVGVIMKVLLEKPKAWHDHPRVRRAMTEATIGWGLMSALRVVVQESLRRVDATGWLAVTKIAMGWPLYLAALAVTMPYINRRTRGVEDELPPEPEPEAEAEPGGEDATEDAEAGV
ncbi:MAG TPA: DUF3159 domain-containing protein [Mycobacteriales bacterium]